LAEISEGWETRIRFDLIRRREVVFAGGSKFVEMANAVAETQD
jgi:hypothetical protein